MPHLPAATTFADLHQGPLPLVLPNAWDVPSALALVAAGFPAVGTTSFGVASSLGRPDGGRATREANRALARDLASLPVPVSVDIEDGYSDDPDEVAAYVAGLEVAGINIEDSTDARLVPPETLAAKVAAIKVRCPEVFVNARVDTYWLHEDESVAATLRRATRYAEAGADGIFVPGARDPDVVRALAQGVVPPLNVLAIPGTAIERLGELGVRRVSTGSLPYRAALGAAVEAALAVRDGREPPPAPAYDALQARLTAYASDRPAT